MIATLRLLIAETLLGWAMSAAPKGHPDTTRLIQAVGGYLKGCKRP